MTSDPKGSSNAGNGLWSELKNAVAGDEPLARYMQMAFDVFHERGEWPTIERLQKQLLRTGDHTDLYATAARIPDDLGTDPVRVENRCRLAVPGVALCRGSEDEIVHFLAVLRLAVDRYLSEDADQGDAYPTISSAELSTRLNIDGIPLRRIHDMTEWVPFLAGGAVFLDGTWQRHIQPATRHFVTTTTIEEYIDTLGAIRLPLSRSVLGSSSFESIQRTLGTPAWKPAPHLKATSEPAPVSPDDTATNVSDSDNLSTQGLTSRGLQREEIEAQELMGRLEQGDQLSAVLPAIRRFAEGRNDAETAQWIRLEILGYDGWQMTKPALDVAVRERIIDLYFRLHQVADPKSDFDGYKVLRRSLLAAAPVAELERSEAPPELQRPASAPDVSIWDMRSKTHHENRLLLIRIREELHEYLSRVLRSIRTLQACRDLLGEQALIVFDAGGGLLVELLRAVTDLGRPGRQATAAMGARTALLTMGRELYRGPSNHTSPITGKSYKIVSEKHMLLAYLDDLWEAASTDQKALVEQAKADLSVAYELGSKGKNPLAISHGEATVAVKKAYSVARTIALCGGFGLATDK